MVNLKASAFRFSRSSSVLFPAVFRVSRPSSVWRVARRGLSVGLFSLLGCSSGFASALASLLRSGRGLWWRGGSLAFWGVSRFGWLRWAGRVAGV